MFQVNLANQRFHSQNFQSLPMFRHVSQKVKMDPEDFLEKTLSEYLGCHPTYMIPLVRAHNFIMRDLGPLNLVTRHYIAMMAASRHRCSFLFNFSKKEYLHNGGELEWLKGVTHCPPKLRALNTLNKILAHQPWLFQRSHIENLTKGSNPWTVSELTQAIIIMVHYHALCTLAFGCKFGFGEPENFDEDDAEYEEVEIEELRFDENGSRRIKKIVKRSPASRLIIERCRMVEAENANLASLMSLKFNENKKGKGKKNGKNGKNAKNEKNTDKANEDAQSNSQKGNANAAESSASTSDNPAYMQPSTSKGPPEKAVEPIKSVLPAAQSTSPVSGKADDKENKGEPFKENTWSEDEWAKHNYDKFPEDASFKYIDFACRPAYVATSRIQDFEWDGQGFSLCNLLYPDISEFLDEKFKVGYNLTYFTLGPKTNIDTSPFRRAIWNYIQCIYGMRYDDYNYREVNILLERSLKCYIKCLACYPERVVKEEFANSMQGFRASEKIHVMIMVAEARLQVELLYALRSLTEFMKVSG